MDLQAYINQQSHPKISLRLCLASLQDSTNKLCELRRAATFLNVIQQQQQPQQLPPGPPLYPNHQHFYYYQQQQQQQQQQQTPTFHYLYHPFATSTTNHSTVSGSLTSSSPSAPPLQLPSTSTAPPL